MNKKTLSLRGKFLAFLEQRGVLELYNKYAIHPDLKHPINWIGGDFVWTNTEEGFHFWAEIYVDWVRIIKQKKNRRK